MGPRRVGRRAVREEVEHHLPPPVTGGTFICYRCHDFVGHDPLDRCIEVCLGHPVGMVPASQAGHRPRPSTLERV
jgi:hypothetical protein